MLLESNTYQTLDLWMKPSYVVTYKDSFRLLNSQKLFLSMI